MADMKKVLTDDEVKNINGGVKKKVIVIVCGRRRIVNEPLVRNFIVQLIINKIKNEIFTFCCYSFNSSD